MTLKQPKKDFVVIEWEDSWHALDNISDSDLVSAHKPLTLFTWGWLLKSDEKGVHISCEWDPTQDVYRDRTFVPRTNVVSETTLTLRKKNARQPKPHTRKEAAHTLSPIVSAFEGAGPNDPIQ